MKRNYVALVISLCALLLIVAVLLLRVPHGAGIEKTAVEIVTLCSNEADHEKCYEREVPKLYGSLSLPQVFDVIRDIRTRDQSYQFCHLLAHKLGEDAVVQDPSHWLNFIPLNPPDSLCSNGFIHGVIIGRFRDDVLSEKQIWDAMPDFKIACEPHDDWHPSPLDQAMCYHAMGHLFDYIDDANLNLSLKACNEIAAKNGFLRVCQEGVFMQMYQPVEPDDYALVDKLGYKLTKDSYRPFCARFSDPDAKGACLREAWPLVREDVVSGRGVEAYCAGQPKNLVDACYLTASAIVGRMSLSDPEGAARACNNFPHSEKLLCFESVAQAFLEENRTEGDRAIAMCNRADPTTAEQCLEALAQRVTFIFQKGSSEAQHFCSLFPSQTRDTCVNSMQ